MPAYRALTHISLGLRDGRILSLRPGDVVPPSWAAINTHQTGQWLSSGAVVLAVGVDPAVLAQADRAAEPRENVARSASTIEEAAAEWPPDGEAA